ncbi:ArnT family glycosyltransferase [Pseudomonas sp. Marseille-QA0892]
MHETPSRARRWLLIGGLALLAFYLITGLVGRGLWKADEPYSFGMTWNYLTTSDWVVPRVGNDPFMEKPPLMYWTGAITAYLFQPWLSAPDASRVAVLGWMLATLVILFRLTERLHPGRGLAACLLMLGIPGMVQHAHLLIADVPQLTGAALGLAGLVGIALRPDQYVRQGLVFGTGFGIALMSKGLLIPGVLAVTACAAALLNPKRYLTMKGMAWVGWSVLAALPWMVVWPLLLWLRDQDLFMDWFWVNNFGRFFGLSQRNSISDGVGSDLKVLAGLTFPAGWALLGAVLVTLSRTLRHGRISEAWARFHANPGLAMVWVYTAVFMAVLLTSAVFRSVYVLPLFPALALVMAGIRLPLRAERILRGFAITLFSLAGAYLWFGWWAIQAGETGLIARALRRVVPVDEPLSPSGLWIVAALVLTGIWIATVAWRRRLEWLHVWFAGITLVWGLANTLWLPWVDLGRSYERPFHAFKATLPQELDCLNTVNLGESERSMLHFYAGIKPVMEDDVAQATCRVQLILDQAKHPRDPDPARWAPLWEGQRSGERTERLRAFIQRSD